MLNVRRAVNPFLGGTTTLPLINVPSTGAEMLSKLVVLAFPPPGRPTPREDTPELVENRDRVG